MKIKYDKILDRLREADTVSQSNGTKFQLFNGDAVTVESGFEYFLGCNFILDAGSSLTLNTNSRLVLHNGPLTNNGLITNNGIIKIGL
jgi:hypothetical protein